nr:MarR family transcriptional regulator [Nocardioides flavescens]
MDLSSTERWIVHAVPGAALVPIEQVTRDLGSSAPVVSRACSQLVEAGHLVRIADPRDRRRVLIGLTDEAAEALREWDLGWPRPYLEAVADWSSADVDRLETWLRLVVTDLGAGRGDPHAPQPATAGSPRPVFETTIRRLVPLAGRVAPVVATAPGASAAVAETEFHLLLSLAQGGSLTTGELAAGTDTDTALARRRLRALADQGLVQSSRGEGRGSEHWRLREPGDTVVTHTLRRLASQLPPPPDPLVGAGLHRLVAAFTTAMLHSIHDRSAADRP